MMTKPAPSPRSSRPPRSKADHRSRRRRDDRNNHRPMNGPAPADSSNHPPSKAHHGREGAGAKSGSMDLDSASLRGHATDDAAVSTTTASLETNNPPPPASSSTSLSATSPKPQSSSLASSSNPPDVLSKPPSITVSRAPPREGEPEFLGPLLLCQKAYSPSKPHPTQDLFELYGVTPLAQGVARRDLATGQKINTMRKTYAGQIKAFQLAGKNKALSHAESGIGMRLLDMGAFPLSEWQNQKLSGKDTMKGLSSGALSKLEKAMKLEPGPVPRNDEWESALGLDPKASKHAPAAGDPKVKHHHLPSAMKPSKFQANGAVNGAVRISSSASVAGGADAEINRPKRAGKKRRYNDDSFEGYGEGFDDDRDDGEGGYSSGDGSRRGSSSKKRRKDYASMNSPIGGGGIGSYAAGLTGVGRGIGAYGSR